jgi:acyl-coenzyme A thioesterase PaaI-like protein
MDDAKASLVNRIFEQAQFVRTLGIELIAFGDGWCEARIAVTPTLEQQHGFVHAGVLTSVVTAKPAIRGHFKTGHRDWPKT